MSDGPTLADALEAAKEAGAAEFSHVGEGIVAIGEEADYLGFVFEGTARWDEEDAWPSWDRVAGWGFLLAPPRLRERPYRTDPMSGKRRQEVEAYFRAHLKYEEDLARMKHLAESLGYDVVKREGTG